MLPRDCLCGYPKRPPVDFPRRSVGRPTKTFQYFHRAAAWYDAAAACPTTLRMSIYARSLLRKSFTQARIDLRNLRNVTQKKEKYTQQYALPARGGTYPPLLVGCVTDFICVSLRKFQNFCVLFQNFCVYCVFCVLICNCVYTEFLRKHSFIA